MLTRQKISAIKDKGLRLRLEKLLSQVTRAMRAVNFTGEFYIAGGCVFDIMTNAKTSNNVDVFVYDDNVFVAAKEKFESSLNYLNDSEHVTRNMAPIDVHATENFIKIDYALQTNHSILIDRVHIGPPEDVFDKFDLVNSMIAITSTGELVKHKSFSSRIIRVNLDAISNSTFMRYFKYRITKGATDPDEAALRKIIDYVIDNPFKGLGYRDTEQPVTDAINALAAAIYTRPSIAYHSQYIHDRIVKMHSDEERIPIFERLVMVSNFRVDCPCTEMALVNIINLREYVDSYTLRNAWKETYHDVINKYPEYFI